MTEDHLPCLSSGLLSKRPRRADCAMIIREHCRPQVTDNTHIIEHIMYRLLLSQLHVQAKV